ncbi:hypothetical protein Tco_1161847, partial [Tanacetum coccineum]
LLTVSAVGTAAVAAPVVDRTAAAVAASKATLDKLVEKQRQQIAKEQVDRSHH